MASEWCDGFLKLVKDGQTIEGESSDAKFGGARDLGDDFASLFGDGESTGAKPDRLIEVISFTFGSSTGFEDGEAQYAAQDRRPKDTFGADFASLFGDPSEFQEEELNEFEGKDLAGVEACKITITKELDLSSPDLFRAYCSTQDLEHRDVFESATLYIRKATGGKRKVFLTFVFNDVVVTGYTLDIGSDAVPKETINLVFGKCRVEYKPQDETGRLSTAIKGGWDMIERTAWID
jgi:type VI protein secretion system component Hcp